MQIPDGELLLPSGSTAVNMFQKTWDPADARATCKVFHHIYAADGTLLTKGLGGKFEHHRGLFVGWNRTQWNGKSFDFWHCNKGESQRFRSEVAAKLLDMGQGAQVGLIDWVAPSGEVVITELRGLEIVHSDEDSYVLHMRVECRANNGQVKLTGDPQHAGQQFRALQQFSEASAQPVDYMRPDTAQSHGNDVWTDCAWIAGIMNVKPNTYTVLRIEAPDNPGETKWSTRPYGRFGATRTATVTDDKPLRIDQYYVIANGTRDAAWCAEQAALWTNKANTTW